MSAPTMPFGPILTGHFFIRHIATATEVLEVGPVPSGDLEHSWRGAGLTFCGETIYADAKSWWAQPTPETWDRRIGTLCGTCRDLYRARVDAPAEGYGWCITGRGSYVVIDNADRCVEVVEDPDRCAHVIRWPSGMPVCGAWSIHGPATSGPFSAGYIRARLEECAVYSGTPICPDCWESDCWQDAVAPAIPTTPYPGPLMVSDGLGTTSLLDLLEGATP